MSSPLTFGSLFAGIGGFDLGFERIGMICRWQVEMDKDCLDRLTKRWPNVRKYEDVRKVGKRNLETVGVIVGGFPCQDVSLAGSRKGLAGKRSGLWFEFLRIIEEIKPRWIVIENVPGLLSSNNGRDMGTILGGLAKCGYWWAYRVLNAQYYGVPQRRRRVFIVGCLRAGCAQEVLFERNSSPWNIAPGSKEKPEITPPITGRSYADSAAEDGKLIAFSAGNSGGSWGLGLSYDLTPPLRASDGGSGTPVIGTLHTGFPGRDASDGAENKLFVWDNGQGDPNAEKSNLAYCLNGQVNQGVGVRRLMPIECERLQGFPDGWTAGQSDTTRYRQLGNAVAVPVAEWVGKRIVEVDNLHFA